MAGQCLRTGRCFPCAVAVGHFAAAAPLVDKTLAGKLIHIQHIDKHFAAEATIRQLAVEMQHATAVGGGNVVFQRSTVAEATTLYVDLMRNSGQRRIGFKSDVAQGIADGFRPHHFIRQHVRAGRGGEGFTGIALEIIGTAVAAPHAVVKHQLAADMLNTLSTHLLLHLQYVFLVEHRIAAAHPINITFQYAVANRRVALKFGLPTEIRPQCAQSGKCGHQLHHRSGLHRHIGTVGFQHLAGLHILHIHRDFLRCNFAGIQCKSGNRQATQ